MSCGPTTEIIFPDPAQLQIVSATSEAEPCTPTVDTDAGNLGALQPIIRGTPEDPAGLPAELRIVQSGDSDVAGYTVQQADQLYQQGMNDAIVNTIYDSPFRQNVVADVDIRLGASACVWSEYSKRTVLVGAPRNLTDNHIRVKLQGIGGDPFAWTSYNFQPEDLGAPERQLGTNQINGPAIVDCEDGGLLLFYTYQEVSDPVGANNQSICCLKSTDGGDSWQLINRKVNRTYVDLSRGMRVARSGSWVRLAWRDSATLTIWYTVSRDNGLTWSLPVDTSLTLPVRNTTEDASPWDLVGLGDGIFLLLSTQSTTQWQVFQARQDAGFSLVFNQLADRFRTVPAVIYSICGVVAWGKVWVFVQTSDGGGSNVGDQIQCYFQTLDSATAIGPGLVTGELPEWQPIEPLTQQRGARHLCQWMSATSICGRELFVLSSLYDDVAAVTEAGSLSMRVAGLSPKPLGTDPVATLRGMIFPPLGDQRNRNSGYQVQWCSPFAIPAGPGGNASPDTDWTRTVVGAPTINYTKARLSLSCTAAESIRYNISQFATGATSWLIDGAVIGGVTRITSGGAIGLEAVALKFQTRESALGTSEIQVQIRVTQGAIYVVDDAAALTRFALIIDCTDYVHVRASLQESGSTRTVKVSAYRLDDPANTLVENTASFSIVPVVTGSDELQFGHTATGVAADSDWKEVYVLRSREAAERDIPSTIAPVVGIPYIYLGIPCLQTVCIGNGLSASWGGAASAIGDAYTLEPCHLYSASNIFRDSPLIGWRAVDDSTQDLVLQVDGASSFRRSVINRAVLMGVEWPDAEITLANDTAFSVDVQGPFALDTRLFTGQLVAGALGDTMRQDVSTPGVRIPYDSELLGKRVLFTSGVLAGQAFSVDFHSDNVLRLTRPGGGSDDLQGLGLANGDTFDVFLPFGVVDLTTLPNQARRRKYIRIRFPAAQTATGNHRLGSFLAGVGIGLPIPLEWTHGDNEEADTTLFEGRGGISWGYEQGPPRRIWTGRVINDYVRWRETMRALLRKCSQYAARPIALFVDKESPETLIFGRWNGGGSNLENSFWWDTNPGDGEIRYPGGDLQVQIVEIPS